MNKLSKMLIIAVVLVACLAVTMTACNKHTHTWSSEWSKDAENHWHDCTDGECGETKDVAAHVLGDTWLKDAANHWKECLCGHKGLIASHTFDGDWLKDETNHWKLCACGWQGALAAHTATDWIIDEDATADKDGSKHKECESCGYLIETAVIAKHVHEFTEWKVTTPATCAADGVETEMCSVCFTLGTNTRAIDKSTVAHTFDSWQTTTTAICAQNGEETEKCSVCGILGTETKTIDKSTVAHTFDEWQTTTPATCGVNGVSTEKCSVCGALGVQTQPIDKSTVAHNFELWHTTTPATCGAEGIETEKCSVCSALGTLTRSIDNSDIAHNYVDGECTVCQKEEEPLFASLDAFLEALDSEQANFTVSVVYNNGFAEVYYVDGLTSKYVCEVVGDEGLAYWDGSGNTFIYNYDEWQYSFYNDCIGNMFAYNFGFYEEYDKDGNTYTYYDSGVEQTNNWEETETIVISPNRVVWTRMFKNWEGENLIEDYMETLTFTFGGLDIEIPTEALEADPLNEVKNAVADLLSPYGIDIPMPQSVSSVEGFNASGETVFFHVSPYANTSCRNYTAKLLGEYGFTYYDGTGSYTSRPQTYYFYAPTSDAGKIVTIMIKVYASGGEYSDYSFDVEIAIQDASVIELPFSLPEGDFMIVTETPSLTSKTIFIGKDIFIYRKFKSSSTVQAYYYRYDEGTENWTFWRYYVSNSGGITPWATASTRAEYNELSLLFALASEGEGSLYGAGSMWYYEQLSGAENQGAAVVGGRDTTVYWVASATYYGFEYSCLLYVDDETGLIIKGDRTRLSTSTSVDSWECSFDFTVTDFSSIPIAPPPAG